MTDQPRPYRMRARADAQLETRRRITESAVALHGTVGPAQTTMSAVAEHAGVRRSTLYRHFPNEAALFDACSAHWIASNPLPDLASWAAVQDPDERLRQALPELYSFYVRTSQMLANLLRDEHASDVLRERFGVFHAYLAAAVETLLVGRSSRGAARRRVAAAIGHAVSFSTWRSLVVEQELAVDDAVQLMCGLIAVAQRG
jgi:AcrR family transcriptional regulator